MILPELVFRNRQPPVSQNIKYPVIAVVTNTPSVANTTPCDAIGFISDSFVSIPPENRMILSAIIPMNWAICGLLNCRPRPSLPKSIPIPKNNSRAGNPTLKPALPARILTNKMTEQINKTSRHYEPSSAILYINDLNGYL
jgi:hypothetical protein